MRIRTTVLVAAAAVALAPVLTGTAAPASAAVPASCAPLTSGQVDPDGTPRAVAAIAPAGHLVTGYCVASGSAAPVYVELAQPVTWVVVRGAAGIGHYSYAWVATDSLDVVEPGQEPATVQDPDPELPATPAPALTPWDWNWTYADPTCDALTVRYPANIPAGQANDVNIRFNSNLGRSTFNYHHNEGTWSGTTSFAYAQHPSYPTSGLRWFTVEWVQVAGTNYHWQGALTCLVGSDGRAETVDVPRAVTSISGFNASTLRVRVGATVAADTVVLDQTDLAAVTLQRLAGGRWSTVKTVARVDGSIRVGFPKETRAGTFGYRLVAPDTAFVTGAVSKTLTVKVVKPAKKRR